MASIKLATAAPTITVEALASQFWSRYLGRGYAGADAAAEALLGVLNRVYAQGGREDVRAFLRGIKERLQPHASRATAAGPLLALASALALAAEQLRQFSPVKGHDKLACVVLEELRSRLFRILTGDAFAGDAAVRRQALDVCFVLMMREEEAKQRAMQRSASARAAAAPAAASPPSPGSPARRGISGIAAPGSPTRRAAAAVAAAGARALGLSGGSFAVAGGGSGQRPMSIGRIVSERIPGLAGPDLGSWAGLWASLMDSALGHQAMPLLQSAMMDLYAAGLLTGGPARGGCGGGSGGGCSKARSPARGGAAAAAAAEAAAFSGGRAYSRSSSGASDCTAAAAATVVAAAACAASSAYDDVVSVGSDRASLSAASCSSSVAAAAAALAAAAADTAFGGDGPSAAGAGAPGPAGAGAGPAAPAPLRGSIGGAAAAFAGRFAAAASGARARMSRLSDARGRGDAAPGAAVAFGRSVTAVGAEGGPALIDDAERGQRSEVFAGVGGPPASAALDAAAGGVDEALDAAPKEWVTFGGAVEASPASAAPARAVVLTASSCAADAAVQTDPTAVAPSPVDMCHHRRTSSLQRLQQYWAEEPSAWGLDEPNASATALAH